MELLVVTLAQLHPEREADGIARVHLLADRVRKAAGLVSAQFFRSRGQSTYYVSLTTWEDEQMWREARERANPKRLLLGAATELLAQAPEQWYMRYLWGYSRPAAEPALASIHLATTYHNQGAHAQRGWIASLRRQAALPRMAFAFLARGMSEQSLPRQTPPGTPVDYGQGAIFLNFLSWSTETEREESFADPNYKAISRYLSSIGVVQSLALESL